MKRSAKKKRSSRDGCWAGYERVPGTKQYAKGSCRKKKDGKKKSKKKSRNIVK